jgi:hypothetical protein
MSRVTWRGKTFTHRTLAMLRWVEAKSGLRLVPAQGSYNAGGVSASGGTHDREAVDLSLQGYSDADIKKLDVWMKRAGFAGWYRPYVPGVWGRHYHALPIKGDLSSAAASQVWSFDQRRDALRSNRPDPSFRPSPKRRWSYPLRRPVPRI